MLVFNPSSLFLRELTIIVISVNDNIPDHISTSQFAQQRLKKGAVIGGWVSSFYLLLPACLTPFLGIFIDVYGQRVTFRECRVRTATPNARVNVRQCSFLASHS